MKIEATLTEVRSHSVRLDWAQPNGLEATREECFAYLKVTVKGTERTCRMECDRYRHSDGKWSGWRVALMRVEPSRGIGAATWKEIDRACASLVHGWLEAPSMYGPSRALAFRWALVDEVRNQKTPGDYRTAAAVRKFSGELSGDDRAQLLKAYRLHDQAMRLLSDWSRPESE